MIEKPKKKSDNPRTIKITTRDGKSFQICKYFNFATFCDVSVQFGNIYIYIKREKTKIFYEYVIITTPHGAECRY